MRMIESFTKRWTDMFAWDRPDEGDQKSLLQHALRLVSRTVSLVGDSTREYRVSYSANANSNALDSKVVYLDPNIAKDNALDFHSRADVLCGNAITGAGIKNVTATDTYRTCMSVEKDEWVKNLTFATELARTDKFIGVDAEGLTPLLDARSRYATNEETLEQLQEAALLPRTNADVACALLAHRLTNRGQNPLEEGVYEDAITQAVEELTSRNSTSESWDKSLEVRQRFLEMFNVEPPPPPQGGGGENDEQEPNEEDKQELQSGDSGQSEQSGESDKSESDKSESESDQSGKGEGASGGGGQSEQGDESQSDSGSGEPDSQEDGQPDEGEQPEQGDEPGQNDGEPEDGEGEPENGEGDQPYQGPEPEHEQASSAASQMIQDMMGLAEGDVPDGKDSKTPKIESLAVGEDEPAGGWGGPPDTGPLQVHRQRPRDDYDKLLVQVAGPARSLARKFLFRGEADVLEEYGLRSGNLDEAVLDRVTYYDADPPVYTRTEVKGKSKIAVGIITDESGSMGQSGKCEAARYVTALLAEALRQVRDIDLCVWGHSGVGKCVIYEYISPALGGIANRASLAGISARGSNYDSKAVKHCAEEMRKHFPEASRRIMFLISDGQPCDDEAWLTRECQRARKAGVEVYGIGIQNAFPQARADQFYGPGNSVIIPDTMSAANIIGSFLVRLAKRLPR